MHFLQRKALMHMFRIHLLVLYEQTEYIAATKLAWTVMFNGNEASGPLTNAKCIKSFGGQKGVNPLVYGPEDY